MSAFNAIHLTNFCSFAEPQHETHLKMTTSTRISSTSSMTPLLVCIFILNACYQTQAASENVGDQTDLTSSNNQNSASWSYSTEDHADEELPTPAHQHQQNSLWELSKQLRQQKRSWQNLQSSWGKRDNTAGFVGSSGPNRVFDSNGDAAEDYAEHLLLLSRPYYSNGDFMDNSERAYTDNGLDFSDDDLMEKSQKRAWKNLNAAWGKRVSFRNNGNSNNNNNANGN